MYRNKYYEQILSHVQVCSFNVYTWNIFLGLATELDSAIDQYLTMGMQGSFQCVECGMSGKKRDVRRHVEAKHIANTYVSCSLCGKVVKTRDSLRKHMERDHKEWKAS